MGWYCLSRRGQTTIFRLRTEHNRLKYHIHKIFKIGETDLCSCGQAAETAQHVLQDCRLYSNVRQSIWRERVDMHTKLYGPLPELEKTVAFIAQAGIGIWRERRRTRRRRRKNAWLQRTAAREKKKANMPSWIIFLFCGNRFLISDSMTLLQRLWVSPLGKVTHLLTQ